MLTSLVLAVLGLALVADVVYSHVVLARAVRKGRTPFPHAQPLPSISVIRPVRGKDVEADANFAAALETGYPGEVETLFVFDDDRDPGYPVAVEAVERHRRSGRPGTGAVLVAGSPPPGRTGKINAMIVGANAAKGQLVAFGDSDTRPDGEVLRATVDALLASPGAGAAFAPVVARGNLSAAGDAGYALMINGWYGPSVALNAEKTGDLPFIMGQLMVFKREAIDAIGGIECADGQLVDDMFLGKEVVRAGYRNILAPQPLRIAMGGMPLTGFLQVLRRWIIFSKSGLPASFTAPMWRRGIQFFVGLIASVYAVASGSWSVALFPIVGLLAYGISLIRLYRVFGGDPLPLRYAYVPWLVPAVAPIVFASSFARRKVEWRGRSYALSMGGQLAVRKPGGAPRPAGMGAAPIASSRAP